MVEKNQSPIEKLNNTDKLNTNVSRLGSGQVFDSSIQIQLRGADSNKINVEEILEDTKNVKEEFATQNLNS